MGGRPSSRVEAALDELCVRYGYCPAPEQRAQLIAEPPSDPDVFLDAVFRDEGLDPDLVDRQTRQALLALVRDWLVDSEGSRGTRSGLP